MNIETEIREIKKQNQQILVLLNLLIASNEEIKRENGEIEHSYNERRYYTPMDYDEPVYVEKENRSYEKYYKARIMDIYKYGSIPLDIVEDILKPKQK